MDCHNCGSSLGMSADADGVFWLMDGDEHICDECGCIHTASCDGEGGHLNCDEKFADIGQPRCDNTCEKVCMDDPKLVAEYLGAPCAWNCLLAKAWKERQAKTPCEK